MSKNITEQMIMNMMDSPSIPLILGLEKVIGASSRTTGLVMQEVEYQFSKHPDGFFMAYEPQKGQFNNIVSESWDKRLCLGTTDFKLNFDKIGVRYGSYNEFNSAEDKFKGKLYCSYYDGKRKQAFYFRNHSLADATFKQALGDRTMADIYEKHEKAVRKVRERVVGKLGQMKQEGVHDFSDLLFDVVCLDLEEVPRLDVNESTEHFKL